MPRYLSSTVGWPAVQVQKYLVDFAERNSFDGVLDLPVSPACSSAKPHPVEGSKLSSFSSVSGCLRTAFRMQFFFPRREETLTSPFRTQR
jgi:hypothetical protein